MRKSLILTVIFLVTLLVQSTTLFAWNYAGHMTIALMAYRKLPESTRQQIAAVLKEHPEYKTVLLQEKTADVKEEEWVFLRASIWPDLVRKRPGDQPVWHYVNKPVRLTTQGMLENLPFEPPTGQTILTALDDSIRMVSQPQIVDPFKLPDLSSAQNRAVRLSWILHLIGDMHQPLHCCSLISEKHQFLLPSGDRGGNSTAARVKDYAPLAALRGLEQHPDVKDMHGVWDFILGGASDYPSLLAAAKLLEENPAFAADKLTELKDHRTFDSWVDEGFLAAKQYVYLNGRFPIVNRYDVEKGLVPATDVPILSPEYLADATQLAHRRFALSSYRMAEKLREVFPQQ